MKKRSSLVPSSSKQVMEEESEDIESSSSEESLDSDEENIELELADVTFEELPRARSDGSHSMYQKTNQEKKGGRANKNRKRKRAIEEQRKSLPIASVKTSFIQHVHDNDVLIVLGETGSGKTTQIPQFLFDAGFCPHGKSIGVTQPRRLAALSVAKRVAEECGVMVGQKVGYSIRFEDVTSASTRIKFMTDGLLLREALLDPYLSRYSVIIVDEAHERTVDTDVLLGYLKRVLKVRSRSLNDSVNAVNTNANSLMLENRNSSKYVRSLKRHQGRKLPLKLIIMSASLNAPLFSEFFGDAKVFHVDGRQYPVAIFYTRQPELDYLEATLISIFQIHLEESLGDVLAFLTGQEEIESVENRVKDTLQKLPEAYQNLVVIPIYSSLPSEQQLRVFAPAPPGVRKVILATNIAETSLTIPGIKYVIDPGFVKARTYDPNKRMESLTVIRTSKAQALQRSGRAGREGPGKCFRPYPVNMFYKFEDSTKPEITRSNLSNVILQLKALGVDNIMEFDFLEKPPRQAIFRSFEQLILLGALVADGELSNPVGHQMAHLPLDPIYSKALIVASQSNCLEEMLIIVSMLSVESIFYNPREKLEEARAKMKFFSSPEGDHLTLINVYRSADEFLNTKKSEVSKTKVEKSFRKWCKENFINSRALRYARDVYSQIRRHVEQISLPLHSCGDDILQLCKCLAASFFLNAATKHPDGTYRVRESGEAVQIHPSSVLFRKKPDCVIFNEFVQTSHKYIRNITRIDQLWLPERASH